MIYGLRVQIYGRITARCTNASQTHRYTNEHTHIIIKHEHSLTKEERADATFFTDNYTVIPLAQGLNTSTELQ